MHGNLPIITSKKEKATYVHKRVKALLLNGQAISFLTAIFFFKLLFECFLCLLTVQHTHFRGFIKIKPNNLPRTIKH